MKHYWNALFFFYVENGSFWIGVSSAFLCLLRLIYSVLWCHHCSLSQNSEKYFLSDFISSCIQRSWYHVCESLLHIFIEKKNVESHPTFAYSISRQDNCYLMINSRFFNCQFQHVLCILYSVLTNIDD